MRRRRRRRTGTFRTSPLFRGLIRFVYLVRTGAGRRAQLTYVTAGITLVSERTWKSDSNKVLHYYASAVGGGIKRYRDPSVNLSVTALGAQLPEAI